jgi:hypothetical protein
VQRKVSSLQGSDRHVAAALILCATNLIATDFGKQAIGARFTAANKQVTAQKPLMPLPSTPNWLALPFACDPAIAVKNHAPAALVVNLLTIRDLRSILVLGGYPRPSIGGGGAKRQRAYNGNDKTRHDKNLLRKCVPNTLIIAAIIAALPSMDGWQMTLPNSPASNQTLLK